LNRRTDHSDADDIKVNGGASCWTAARLRIDRFGWIGMEVHPFNGWRILDAALMVSGITLIAKS
jgi:Putative inner membrane exporter, YdcZ